MHGRFLRSVPWPWGLVSLDEHGAALAAAETASAALQAELRAQGEKLALTRSYTRAAELAVAAKAAADAAAAEAVTGKEQMKITEGTNIVRRVFLNIFLFIRDNTRTKIASLDIPMDKVIEVGFVKDI